MKFKIATIALTVLMSSSCSSSKNVISEEPKQISNEVPKEEFIKGQIVSFDGEGDCAYAIKTIGEGFEYLDPLNLDDKYKIDGQQIWFKYRGLRRENRCENARPVEIIEIMIREK